MVHIVCHQESKGASFGRNDRARRRKLAVRYQANDMCEVAIVQVPEFNQCWPFAQVIVVLIDPRVLFVLGKDKFLLLLGANEALMIIARGINQVTDNFGDRPTFGSWLMPDRVPITRNRSVSLKAATILPSLA